MTFSKDPSNAPEVISKHNAADLYESGETLGVEAGAHSDVGQLAAFQTEANADLTLRAVERIGRPEPIPQLEMEIADLRDELTAGVDPETESAKPFIVAVPRSRRTAALAVAVAAGHAFLSLGGILRAETSLILVATGAIAMLGPWGLGAWNRARKLRRLNQKRVRQSRRQIAELRRRIAVSAGKEQEIDAWVQQRLSWIMASVEKQRCRARLAASAAQKRAASPMETQS